MQVEGMVAYAPCGHTLVSAVIHGIRLTLDAGLHQVISADGTVFNLYILFKVSRNE